MSCSECVSGTVNEGTPVGNVTRKYGFDTYVAAPPTSSSGKGPRGVVVFVPDGFGWTFVNSRVLADRYAREGNFLVYLPEFMNGWGMDPVVMDYMSTLQKPGWLSLWYKPYYLIKVILSFIPFLVKNRLGTTYPRVLSFLRSLRADQELKGLPVGAAGFCWGGKHSVFLAADHDRTLDGQTFVDAVYVAHPSGLSLPVDAENVKLPISFALGSKDFMTPPKKIEVIRTALEKKSEAEHEVVVYEGAKHGWAVRGDPGDKKQKEQGEQAGTQAIEWFGSIFDGLRRE